MVTQGSQKPDFQEGRSRSCRPFKGKAWNGTVIFTTFRWSKAALAQSRVSVGGICTGSDVEGHQRQSATEWRLLDLSPGVTY